MSENYAWAAGFIDGEGTFGIQRQKGKKDIAYLQAAQTDREVLDKLAHILGVGKVYGPYKPKRANWSAYYYYRLTGDSKVKSTFIKLEPYLSTAKKKQMESLLSVRDSVLKTGGV